MATNCFVFSTCTGLVGKVKEASNMVFPIRHSIVEKQNTPTEVQLRLPLSPMWMRETETNLSCLFV